MSMSKTCFDHDTVYFAITEHKRSNLRKPPTWRKYIVIGLAALLISSIFIATKSYQRARSTSPLRTQHTICEAAGRPQVLSNNVERFQDCSVSNFLGTGLPFLESASPLPVHEFVERRNRLAVALTSSGVDAFVAEPGFTFKYYTNISQTDWEPWEPEERPFLMVIKPIKDSKTGLVSADTFFLAPAFEAERVRLLGMPFTEPIRIIEWQEHWNPYKTLFDSDAFGSLRTVNAHTPVIMVDEEMRDFIQRGLNENGFEVVGLNGDVERVRQTKSSREVGILRAVNTGTVEAVRQMRKCLRPGFTENEVRQVLDSTLSAAGLDPFFNIVLFNEDASNPHGGTDGSKRLDAETLVLIDVGAHLYGYSSDITRTFFPPYVSKPTYPHISSTMQEKLKVWDIVFEAQTKSIQAMRENITAAAVDIAARTVIDDAGYRDAFTHRLGHGIGIKAHESPYLNKGNVNTTLHAGMAFTSEPGVYLVDKFGVRHEDVLLVHKEGDPSVLSGTRAKGPWDP